ncbi:hypothetical protein ScPMuIL_002953 [Solemya velum]
MQYVILAFALLAVVYCQPGNHTPDLTTSDFFVDTRHHIMVLKTPSGCYVTHINRHEEEETVSSAHLKVLEAEMLAQLKTHRAFSQHGHVSLHFFNDQIRTACHNMHIYNFAHDHTATH